MAEPVTTQAIKDVSLEPRIASGDQGSIENFELRDLIAADKYLRSVGASKGSNRRSMLKSLFTKLSPPGSRG